MYPRLGAFIRNRCHACVQSAMFAWSTERVHYVEQSTLPPAVRNLQQTVT